MRSIVLFLFLSLPIFPVAASITPEQRAKIDELTGAKGTYTADEDTHRVAFPRNDLKFLIEGRQYAPFMGFSSWAAFTSGQPDEAMVMGDMVLLEDESSPSTYSCIIGARVPPPNLPGV